MLTGLCIHNMHAYIHVYRQQASHGDVMKCWRKQHITALLFEPCTAEGFYFLFTLFFFIFFSLLPEPEAVWGRGSMPEAPQTAEVLLPSSEFLCLGTGAWRAKACDIAYWCLSTIASIEYTIHTRDAIHEAIGYGYSGDHIVNVTIMYTLTVNHHTSTPARTVCGLTKAVRKYSLSPPTTPMGERKTSNPQVSILSHIQPAPKDLGHSALGRSRSRTWDNEAWNTYIYSHYLQKATKIMHLIPATEENIVPWQRWQSLKGSMSYNEAVILWNSFTYATSSWPVAISSWSLLDSRHTTALARKSQQEAWSYGKRGSKQQHSVWKGC